MTKADCFVDSRKHNHAVRRMHRIATELESAINAANAGLPLDWVFDATCEPVLPKKKKLCRIEIRIRSVIAVQDIDEANVGRVNTNGIRSAPKKRGGKK